MKLLVLQWIACGFNFAEVYILQVSPKANQEKDAKWLNSLMNEGSIEWNIFDGVNQIVKYLCGPLFDAPPLHPFWSTTITPRHHSNNTIVYTQIPQ